MLKAIMKVQECTESEALVMLEDSLSTMAYDIRNGDNRYHAACVALKELCIPMHFESEILEKFEEWIEENPEEVGDENDDFELEDILNLDSFAGINMAEIREMCL